MGFEYLTNIPADEARKQYINKLLENGFCGKTETVSTSGAFGRVTAKAVYARICAPHYAASAMDGIALSAAASFGATETTPVTLSPEQFVVLDTGDPIPEGCDAVIMVEDIVNNEDGSVTIRSAAAPWQHIRQIGEDICAGEMILPAFTEITPACVGAMIAGGVMEAEVLRRPVVGIIPTGDEIVLPCADPRPGDILEFNSSIFSGMLTSWNAEAKVYPIVPDKFDEIKAAVNKAAAECDIVLLNAGSSAGREDYSARAIGEVGEVLYHGIAIKPGKPAILGYAGNVPVLGVPGYPVSGIIVIEQFLRPVIDLWYNRSADKETTAQATLTRAVVSGLKYREFVRIRMGYVGSKLTATPLARGSGVISSFMKADGILDIPQNREGFEAGETVSVRLLCSREKLENTLVVIGSHDPLLDELGNMMHSANNSVYMSSSHVGSMGGLMAIKRGEAHAAGTHILDPETGEYNLSSIRKLFPDGGVKLIRCVGRNQGLMVAQGNPLNIEKFEDISRSGLRYVNRQKGSGTRILSDFLCKKHGVDPAEVYGYNREEFTHTSVAAQIANNSADVGMGIYSAAKLYDLDFIPLCIEEYDLLVSDAAWDTPMVQQMLSILKSEAFAAKIEEIGGYTLDRPGEIIEV